MNETVVRNFVSAETPFTNQFHALSSPCPPSRQEGEVCVSGPNVMQGYNNLPEASAEVFFEADGQRCERNDFLA